MRDVLIWIYTYMLFLSHSLCYCVVANMYINIDNHFIVISIQSKIDFFIDFFRISWKISSNQLCCSHFFPWMKAWIACIIGYVYNFTLYPFPSSFVDFIFKLINSRTLVWIHSHVFCFDCFMWLFLFYPRMQFAVVYENFSVGKE